MMCSMAHLSTEGAGMILSTAFFVKVDTVGVGVLSFPILEVLSFEANWGGVFVLTGWGKRGVRVSVKSNGKIKIVCW